MARKNKNKGLPLPADYVRYTAATFENIRYKEYLLWSGYPSFTPIHSGGIPINVGDYGKR